MRSSPWLHQRRSESAPPAERPREPPTMSLKEQDESTARISRPTESALYRKSLYWKLESFMDKGFHSWSKMDLFDDCKRCMWTHDGTIKQGCKIRPVVTSGPSCLPPLPATARSVMCEKTGRATSRANDGANTSRSSWGGGGAALFDRASTRGGGKHRSSLSGGLAMLGNVSGARYRLHNRPAGIGGLAPVSGGNKYPGKVSSLAVPRVAAS